jgi:hypothetical protein
MLPIHTPFAPADLRGHARTAWASAIRVSLDSEHAQRHGNVRNYPPYLLVRGGREKLAIPLGPRAASQDCLFSGVARRGMWHHVREIRNLNGCPGTSHKILHRLSMHHWFQPNLGLGVCWWNTSEMLSGTRMFSESSPSGTSRNFSQHGRSIWLLARAWVRRDLSRTTPSDEDEPPIELR